MLSGTRAHLSCVCLRCVNAGDVRFVLLPAAVRQHDHGRAARAVRRHHRGTRANVPSFRCGRCSFASFSFFSFGLHSARGCCPLLWGLFCARTHCARCFAILPIQCHDLTCGCATISPVLSSWFVCTTADDGPRVVGARDDGGLPHLDLRLRHRSVIVLVCLVSAFSADSVAHSCFVGGLGADSAAFACSRVIIVRRSDGRHPRHAARSASAHFLSELRLRGPAEWNAARSVRNRPEAASLLMCGVELVERAGQVVLVIFTAVMNAAYIALCYMGLACRCARYGNRVQSPCVDLRRFLPECSARSILIAGGCSAGPARDGARPRACPAPWRPPRTRRRTPTRPATATLPLPSRHRLRLRPPS